MINWKLTHQSMWCRTEVGYLGDFHLSTIQSTFEQPNHKIVSVTITFHIDDQILQIDSPFWYINPEYSYETYQHNFKKYNEQKKRFDNLSSGNYTECYEWVERHLCIFLTKARLQYGGVQNKIE